MLQGLGIKAGRARVGVGLAAIAVAGATVGCGGDDGEETTTPTVAEGPLLSAKPLERCIKQAGVETGEAGKDAVLADYSDRAVAAGGDSFVVLGPPAQVIVFPEQVDLVEAEDELRAAANRNPMRADGLQADAYGNVLVTYFVPGGADKAVVNGCLGADARAVPGLEAPFVPSGLAPGVTQ